MVLQELVRNFRYRQVHQDSAGTSGSNGSSGTSGTSNGSSRNFRY
jgi:hypothetical protein